MIWDVSVEDVDALNSKFDQLPLLVEGESKTVRLVSADLVLIRLKPTLYSYRANRAAIAPGTDSLRLGATKILWGVLHRAGIPVAVRGVGSRSYLADRIIPPPIEVIVKGFHVGTPKHIYRSMETIPTRFDTFIKPGERHAPYVRFDWRNPLPERDECLPLALAHQFIDTRAGESTALQAFSALSIFLEERQITLQDICFFITADGRHIFGEVSPDCMRIKQKEEDLDKDLWRAGKTTEEVCARWKTLLKIIQGPVRV